ncbi:DUF1254 domain-containing protein [Streptomyces xinghaiensis]|uniref:DUF1254 domain-containing protein n=1 Tax=Streptomyces xinghaiensis TaxID=1038928 RepID=UPI002E11CEB3|nr:DUF1254 domain-containing protein [Streptomyces xinghaiensis]
MQRAVQLSPQVMESISTPERVETHLGTLEFPLGVPTDETADRLYEHLDRLDGVRAFLDAYSGVSVWAARKGFLKTGARDHDVLLFSEFMDPGALVLTGNADTVYFLTFLDLTEGPVVVEMPPLTLSFVNDMWFRWVADPGMPGPDRGTGGAYLFVPPGYEGPLPEGGFFTHRVRTTRLILAGRAFLEGDDPKPAVERIKERLRIHRYLPGLYGTSVGEILTGGTAPPLPWTAETWTAALRRPDPPRFVEASGLPLNTVPPADETYFDFANELVEDQPAEALDPEIAGPLAAVGIVKGKPFQPDARMRRIIAEAAVVGNATARTLACRPRPDEGAHFYGTSSQWVNGLLASGHDFMTPPADITGRGAEPRPSSGARKLNLRSWWWYLAVGISPTFATRLTGVGSQYLFSFADREGRPLDGGRHYRLVLPPGIPAARFWSVTVYDNQTRSMIDTPQRFPRAGSQDYPTPAAVAAADGTTTVRFGPGRPDGVPEGNWIRTTPARGWFVVLRLYSPLQPFFDRTWRPGEVEAVG